MSHHTSRFAPRPSGSALAFGGLLALLTLPLVAGTTQAATPKPAKGTPPVAVITVPSTVYAGIPVTLSGARSSSTGGSISEWNWDLGNDGRFELQSLSESWVTKSFDRGRHTVRLRVRGGDGLVGTSTKSFTTVAPPAAAARPGAPTAASATAYGTEITVEWEPPVGAAALAYTVTATAEGQTDAASVTVPAATAPTATFTDLVPSEYTIDVVAINAKGSGPVVSTDAEVVSKGDTTSSPSASAQPPVGSETAAVMPVPAQTNSVQAATASNGTDRDVLGFSLIGGGIVVLLGAVVAAVVSARRRPMA